MITCCLIDQDYDCRDEFHDDDEEDWNRLEGGDGKEPVEGDEGKVGPEFDQNQILMMWRGRT